ncbi:hypothetical protein A2X44_00130 [candidate division CPR3 bacterium GWF2_35_18]|nr:MAG: hypothetical protein A2X44_00130 [candidate division CPR3 bacterium GWF2_35_18]OGB65604.1 MAG: hypothetical protein A2250_02380 [candidate division CPR3 bacterium RIFOXYA2_FULL_35_13]OGB79585.1 MAG: hypothetical protein A2296_03125 [candidate division CPR3 bacterium RIFOXYB2_FULL_35_8]OGB80009.1 MAG: hypothetical protein A2011_02000 [candidate division CPR3 bacterium GWE2_35_7]
MQIGLREQKEDLIVQETIADKDILDWMRVVEDIDNMEGNKVSGDVLHFIKGLVPPEENFSLSRNYLIEQMRNYFDSLKDSGYSEKELEQAWSMLRISGINEAELFDNQEI